MKGMFKKLCLGVLAVGAGLTVASCGDSKSHYSAFTEDQYRVYALSDLDDVLASCGAQSQYDATVWSKIQAEYQSGKSAINSATTKEGITAAFVAAKKNIASAIPYANGGFTFVGESNATKTEILGLLEAYAVRNGITGISLFENGSYNMYADRVTLGTENYIVGYGFGTLAEGNITADLASEPNAAWKRYYHSLNVADPGTANYLNDQGSEVAAFYSYFAGTFFTQFMNDTKDGYDWVPELASSKPEAIEVLDEQGTVGLRANGTATKWKFKVKTGDHDGLKYTTNSTKADRANFNNRGVAIEDYETAFKFLLTQANHLSRGSELAKTKTGAIKGAAQYYDNSANGVNETAWANVGIKSYVDGDGQGWFEYEFTQPVSPFYAMYYINSSLYQPIPQDFIDAVGVTGEGDEAVTNYCGYNSDKSYTPVDNSLALGAYVLEAWVTEQEVVYKKNPNYVYAGTKYKIPGIHIKIFPAASTDNTAAFKEFLAGNTDAAGIPQDYLEQYKNDPRTRSTTGDSNFKLNVNATDAETWEKLFGVNGTVTHTAKSDYWEVEPALSNPHFVKALSYAINRTEFADKRGSIASVDYLSSNYMSDPENGISYAKTDAHKQAVEGLLDGTVQGYNLQLARDYFKLALEELVAEGKYVEGTKKNPTVIELEIAWMYPQHEEGYHNEIAKYFMDAFNDNSVSGGKFRLDVKFWVGDQWSDVYYKKLMVGQYDLGFGSISGNSLNPLDFVSVLSSDQSISGEFTLNWGTDTNDPDADILVYKGQRWSFDALWTAANATAIVLDGKNCPSATVVDFEQELNADGSHSDTITLNIAEADNFEITIDYIAICSYADKDNYYEDYLVEEGKDYSITKNADGTTTILINLPADMVEAFTGDMGYDVIYTIQLDSEEYGTEAWVSVYGEFAVAAAE